jgi:hypothetical protein
MLLVPPPQYRLVSAALALGESVLSIADAAAVAIKQLAFLLQRERLEVRVDVDWLAPLRQVEFRK